MLFRYDYLVSATIAPIDSPWGKRLAGELPARFTLLPNSPNPFNSTTEIRYDLPIDCQVNLTIYDIAGRKVRQLIDEQQSAGYKSAIWDGRNDAGIGVASGVYIYRLETPAKTIAKQMLLLK